MNKDFDEAIQLKADEIAVGLYNLEFYQLTDYQQCIVYEEASVIVFSDAADAAYDRYKDDQMRGD